MPDGEFRFEDLPALPFGTFGEELDNLIQAVANKLDREWPRELYDAPEAGSMLRSLVLISANTYSAIRYLTSDDPAVGRRLEFAVAVGPLVRSILDCLCTAVFVLEDVRERTDWFMRAGWREVAEEYERYSERRSGSEAWDSWLDGYEKFVEDMREAWGISEEEATDIKKIKYWPIPSQMLRDKHTSEERLEYLRLLYDWFYRELSAESHLSWPGMARRSHFLFEGKPDVLKKAKSDAAGFAVVFMLALVSELEIEFRWDLRERLLYVWGVLTPYLDFAKEIYEARYSDLL